MAKYERIVTTEAGLELLENAAYMGGSIQFTALKAGNGTYDGTEDLAAATDLKSVCQTFGIGSVTKKEGNVIVRIVIDNNDITEGYKMTELGLYVTNPDTGEEILYAIILAEAGYEDYLPPYADAPTSITFEAFFELTETTEAVTFTSVSMEGVYVPVASFNEHLQDKDVHVTTAEKEAWNALIGGGSLTFTDVSIPTDLWVEDTTYEDYPYRADIPCDGVTEEYYPEVVFDVPEATSGNYAPVTHTGDGIVSIYAKEVPADAIVIPSIYCEKAVEA